MSQLYKALLLLACGGALCIFYGCGGSDDNPSSRTSSVTAVPSEDVLVGRDEPPGGVPRQVQYYQQGSPPPCDGVWADTLSLGVGHSSSHEFDPKLPYASDRAIDGDQVFICVDPTRKEAEVKLRVTYPGGELKGAIGASDSTWEVPLADGILGRYRVRAEGPSGASISFTLKPARTPAYRVVDDPGREPHVLVVGLKPHELIDFHVYDYNDAAKSAQQLRATYRATQHARADDRGRLLVHLDPRAAPIGNCYLIKADVEGRFLYDANTTLGGYCARRGG